MASHVTDIVLQRSIKSYYECEGISPVIAESDIEIVERKCDKGCEVGDNFLGQILRVQVDFKLPGEPRTKSLPFIVKIIDHTAPSNGEILSEMNVFDKESLNYRTILPLLKDITKDRGFGPKCYYIQEEPVRLIIMEDLQARGYFMADRQVGIDYDHCVKSLEKLAGFHAASMVLAEQNPEVMKSFTSGMVNIPMVVNMFYKGFLAAVVCLLEEWVANGEEREFGEILRKIKKIQVRIVLIIKTHLSTE